MGRNTTRSSPGGRRPCRLRRSVPARSERHTALRLSFPSLTWEREEKENAMKILHLYFSSTGNTAKVADCITSTAEKLGHQIEAVKITGDTDIDLLSYDFIFVGSGVYQWLPGKGLQEFIAGRLAHYAAAGEIKYASPRRPGNKVVIYCTYGGAHTGANEAVPAVKFKGQLFDHLG